MNNDRVAMLERDIRWLKWIVLLLAFVSAREVLVSQATADSGRELRATRFILEDGEGNEVGGLTQGAWGASVFLKDANQRTRVNLSAARPRPGLTLMDQSGRSRVVVSLEEDTRGKEIGEPSVSVLGPGGEAKWTAPK